MVTKGERGPADPVDPRSPGSTSRMKHALAAFATARDEDAGGHYAWLCAAGVATLAVRGASLLLITPAGLGTLLAASDKTSERVADLQLTAGEGPALDAFRFGAPVLEPVMDGFSTGRWTGFAPAALDMDVQAMFAFPLQVGAIRLGALCLDGDRPGPLLQQDLRDALLLAKTAVVSILNHLSGAPSVDGWAEEVDGYMSAVHQATGMIMVQLDTTVESALLRLRAHSFASGRPIASVATDVVARRLSFRGMD